MYILHDRNVLITFEVIAQDLAIYDTDHCTAAEMGHSKSVARLRELPHCEVLNRNQGH